MILESLARVSRCHAEFMKLMNRGIPETTDATHAVAAMDPIRHVVWVQVGIARGALECVLGAIYLARGIVTWQQAGFGIMIAALVTVAYIVLYPRRPRVIQTAGRSATGPAPLP